MAIITTATKKLLKLKKRIRAASGGTGASKTYSWAMILIDYAQSSKNELIEIVSETFPHLEGGVMEDFKNIMKDRNYWNDSNWNATKHIYEFETGSRIKFTSFDKIGKAHGPRRDVLFLNECNYMNYEIVRQLMLRTRKFILLDWNPSNDFWFYEEGFPQRDDVDFMGEGGNYPPLTYLDNEALSQPEIDEILALKSNVNLWRVYGLGLRGQLEHVIFKDWQFVDQIPEGARLERRWLDFGYTNDESAIGEVWYCDSKWYVKETLYRKGMQNKQLADHLLALPQNETLIIADSAEPKSIDEIASYGLNIVGVDKKVKGMGSGKGQSFVNWSIQLVQDQPICVVKSSLNIIKEYRNYLWKIDNNGKILNEEDPACKNHHMRGLAYALTSLNKIKPPENVWDVHWEEELHPEQQPSRNLGR